MRFAEHGWRAVRRILVCGLLGLSALGFAGAASAMDDNSDKKASGSGSGSEAILVKARTHIAQEQWTAAIEQLELALGDDSDNADILNLLGYSHRNLENYDDALVFYRRALAIAPEHKGANEYLGELYLRTDKLNEAEERLAALDKACFLPCKEFTELQTSIERYKSKKGLK